MLIATTAWVALLVVFMGLASIGLGRLYGDAIVAVWWGALVIAGGSIWTAVMLHVAGNALVAVQGLATPIAEPAVVGYTLLLLFSMPLGRSAFGRSRGVGVNPQEPLRTRERSVDAAEAAGPAWLQRNATLVRLFRLWSAPAGV